MNPTSEVIGIEHIPELVEMSKTNLTNDDGMIEKVKVILGDGRNSNDELTGHFDAIHVGAAAPRIPEFLMEKLANNGRMIIPVGPEGETQTYKQIDKDDAGKVEITNMMGVIYVPLTDKNHQLEVSSKKVEKYQKDQF